MSPSLLTSIPNISGSCVQVSCPFANESVCLIFDPCQLAGTCNGTNTTTPRACNTSDTTIVCTACTLLSTQAPLPSISESKPPVFCPPIVTRFANCSSSPPSRSTHPVSLTGTPLTFAPPISATSQPSNSSSVTTRTIAQSSRIMSPTSRLQLTPSTPISTPIPSNPPKTTASNAGAIAGGVVGGVLFLSLLTIGVLYFRRWRIQRRVAPSAEFMFLAGPGASYSRALNESPPPEYLVRNTPDPVLEKAYRSAEAQRRLDSNDTSAAAWEHPV